MEVEGSVNSTNLLAFQEPSDGVRANQMVNITVFKKDAKSYKLYYEDVSIPTNPPTLIRIGHR